MLRTPFHIMRNGNGGDAAASESEGARHALWREFDLQTRVEQDCYSLQDVNVKIHTCTYHQSTSLAAMILGASSNQHFTEDSIVLPARL